MDLAWLLVVPAYLLGTFPTAVLVGRHEGHDVTSEGSGNPGASNTYRTMGRRAGAIVLLGDVAKGAVAAGMGLATGNRAVGVACGPLLMRLKYFARAYSERHSSLPVFASRASTSSASFPFTFA